MDGVDEVNRSVERVEGVGGWREERGGVDKVEGWWWWWRQIHTHTHTHTHTHSVRLTGSCRSCLVAGGLRPQSPAPQ